MRITNKRNKAYLRYSKSSFIKTDRVCSALIGGYAVSCNKSFRKVSSKSGSNNRRNTERNY